MKTHINAKYLLLLITIVCIQKSIACTDFPISISNISTCSSDLCYYTQSATSEIILREGSSACFNFKSLMDANNVERLSITVYHAYATFDLINCYYSDDPVLFINSVCSCWFNIFSADSCPSSAPHTPFALLDKCYHNRESNSDCPLGFTSEFSFWYFPYINNRYKICEISNHPSYEISLNITFNGSSIIAPLNHEFTNFTDPNDKYNILFDIPKKSYDKQVDFYIFDTVTNNEFYLTADKINYFDEQNPQKLGFFASNGEYYNFNNMTDAKIFQIYQPDLKSCVSDNVQLRTTTPKFQDLPTTNVRSYTPVFGFTYCSNEFNNDDCHITGFIAYSSINVPILSTSNFQRQPVRFNQSVDTHCSFSTDYNLRSLAQSLHYTSYIGLITCNDIFDLVFCIEYTDDPNIICSQTIQDPFLVKLPDTSVLSLTDIRVLRTMLIRNNNLRSATEDSSFTLPLVQSTVLANILYKDYELSFYNTETIPQIWDCSFSNGVIQVVASANVKQSCYISTIPNVFSSSSISLDLPQHGYQYKVVNSINTTTLLTISCGYYEANCSIKIDTTPTLPYDYSPFTVFNKFTTFNLLKFLGIILAFIISSIIIIKILFVLISYLNTRSQKMKLAKISKILEERKMQAKKQNEIEQIELRKFKEKQDKLKGLTNRRNLNK